LGVPTVADKPNAGYLYYVGCAGAFDDRNKKSTQAFARLLQKAGVDFACLGKEEPCNGETARRLGNEYLYQTMAQACIESFDTAGVKEVIVNCPHCFNTIKNEFPQFGGRYEVIHAAELVAQLIAQGRLQVPPEFRKKTVYHDSCYYGRFNEIYDEPRTVLARAGAEVQEMRRHKQFGMCCGAGGGRMWIEEDPDKRVNLLRTAQALETNPEVIAVSCPFCMTMLSDGIKAKELEDKVQTLDVMEIVARRAPWVNRLFVRAEEQVRESAMIPYAIAVLLTILTVPKLAALVAICTLAVADPLAAVVGIRYGRRRIARNRTLEGSLAF